MSICDIFSSRRIFLYCHKCDMRRSFDKLACMVNEELGENPLSGDLFLFLNKTRKKLKVLYWDVDGYAIWYKRLEKGSFIKPQINAKEICRAELMNMLDGLEIKVIKKQKRYKLLKEK